MNIAVIGAGYVGLTTAAILANCNKYVVYLIDVDKSKIKTIQSGKSYFYEDGLDQLIDKSIDDGNLIPTSDYSKGIKQADIVFSCVGTPDNPDGSSNLSYIFNVAEEAKKHMKLGTIYVQKSTVPVGTGDEISKTLNNAIYVSNPEFLREGTAILDSLWFDRVVVGSENKKAINDVIKIYKTITEERDYIGAVSGTVPPKNAIESVYIDTSLRSAELIKVTSNAYLALKISFANSIAILADKVNADVKEVLDAVGSDKRIGKEFFNAGHGYGGGCFPKDVSGLIHSAKDHNVDLDIMIAAADVNAKMPTYVVSKIKQALNNSLSNKKIALLGLSFKPGTSDTRKSPSISIGNILADQGAIVLAYDPVCNDEAKDALSNAITLHRSIEECIQSVDAVCIATAWDQIKDFDLNKMKSAMNGNIFIDAMNAYNANEVKKVGLHYIGIGRN